MPESLYALPSGRVVRLQMPDLYGILATVGRVPSQQMVDLLNLLVADGAYSPQGGDGGEDKYLRKREQIRGKYAIAALCLAEPTLDLSLKPTDPRPAGVIGTTDLNWRDVEVIYDGWFRGWTLHGLAPDLGADDPGGPAGPPPDGEGVREPPKRNRRRG